METQGTRTRELRVIQYREMDDRSLVILEHQEWDEEYDSAYSGRWETVRRSSDFEIARFRPGLWSYVRVE